jgi:hypothetical protein
MRERSRWAIRKVQGALFYESSLERHMPAGDNASRD